MSDSIIEIIGLKKSYDSQVVLRDVSLSVEQGQVVALVGENGAGKTTLLEIIMGLRHSDAGSVSVMGKDALVDGPALRGNIGFLSETVPFHEYMTIEQLLNFHSQFYKSWNDDTAAELLKKLKLDARVKIADLSRGQKLRAGIVTAISHHPRILIFDEVTAGMDPLVRHQLMSIIKNEQANYKTTVLFATNMLHQLQSFATHITLLQDGSLSAIKAIDVSITDLESYFVSLFEENNA